MPFTQLMLLLQIVERKPPSLVAVIGIGISWVLALVTILRFRMDLAKARRELKADAEKKIAAHNEKLRALVDDRVKEYITGKEYVEQRDKRIKDLIDISTLHALDKYGPSFVKIESNKAIDDRFERLEKDVLRLQEFLANRVSFKVDRSEEG